MSMDAAGVIAQYVLEGDLPLTSTSSGNKTFFLYGRGPIGEKTSTWNYSLLDGSNTPRQLTAANGDVTLSARYTPWGNTLELNGTGNFTFGYIGGILDAATNLIYVGNGQYYDPTTGRFLTRGVNPESPNPYVPWNPVGAILGPLSLVSLVALRRRGKGSKNEPYWLLILFLVVLPVTVGMACGTPTQPSNPPVQPQTPVPVTETPGPVTAPPTVTPTPTAPATSPASPCENCAPTPTPGINEYELKITGTWDESMVLRAVSKLGEKFSVKLGGIPPASAFVQVYGSQFEFWKTSGGGVCEGGARVVVCYGDNLVTDRLLVHELGHALQHTRYTDDTQGPYGSLENAQIVDDLGRWVTGKHPGGEFERTMLGYLSDRQPDVYHGPAYYVPGTGTLGFTTWNSNNQHEARNEDFADMFMNWAYNTFDYSPSAYNAGTYRYNWIDDNMLGWITGGRL